MDKEKSNHIIGFIVTSFRVEQGLTRYALAKRTGLDYSWLRRLELGLSGINVETLILLAKNLNTPASTLIDIMEKALEDPDRWLAEFEAKSKKKNKK